MSAEPREPTTDITQKLSRRELLKALTAAGGAVAASSLLPAKWARPEVGAGALPVHAQSTGMFDCSIEEPLVENIASNYVFSTNPILPSFPVRIDIIVMTGGPTVISSTTVATGAQGTYQDSYWIGCGSAGNLVTIQFRHPTVPQIYCVIGPLVVQSNPGCGGG